MRVSNHGKLEDTTHRAEAANAARRTQPHKLTNADRRPEKDKITHARPAPKAAGAAARERGTQTRESEERDHATLDVKCIPLCENAVCVTTSGLCVHLHTSSWTRDSPHNLQD